MMLSRLLSISIVALLFCSFAHSAEIRVERVDSGLSLRWPIEGDVTLRLEVSGNSKRALFPSIGYEKDGEAYSVLENIDPVVSMRVGSRDSKKGWKTFFDKTHRRPSTLHVAKIERGTPTARRVGERVVLSLGRVSCGPFRGDLELTIFPGSPLLLLEAVVSTDEDWRAILYDAGIVSRTPNWRRTVWVTTDDFVHSEPIDRLRPEAAFAVKHRCIVAEAERGSVAVFPPPHQFFDPLDDSFNLKYVWRGRAFAGTRSPFGLGVRHEPRGDDRYVPWFNAPPGTKQRLRMMILVEAGSARHALRSTLRFTRGDRFARIPGYRTFTSHYHIEHAVDVERRRKRGEDTSEIPQFVDVFRKMGVEIVHLGEFHLAGNPRHRGEKRLEELHLLHEECRRLSSPDFLLLPGEEPNVYFGGHWMSFFPRPVYWFMNRAEGQPFVEDHPKYGKVYRVGNSKELLELLRREEGLAWTAHARVKSSRGFPDRQKNTDFYRSKEWLGAAWKAMPGDLSRDRLGERVLDLLDDMANWGQKKYVIGEVDVFRIDSHHELYGHMNINYLRIDEIPKYDDDWEPVLDALRNGEFFVTTGEVLVPEFQIGGKRSGKTYRGDLSAVPLVVDLDWTFPLSFAEVISGDGKGVERTRIDLSDTKAFGKRRLSKTLNLKEKRWVRFEVWDSVSNGAFTQPVWLEAKAN
ncbi:MAG: hypothetical protein AAF517_03775 [Planctomycetota bacterium]